MLYYWLDIYLSLIDDPADRACDQSASIIVARYNKKY